MVPTLDVRVAEPLYPPQGTMDLRPWGLPCEGLREEGFSDSSLEFATFSGCPDNLEQKLPLQDPELCLQLRV